MKRYDSEWMASLWVAAFCPLAASVEDQWGNKVTGMNEAGFKSKLITAFEKSKTGTLESPIDIRPDIADALNTYWQGTTLDIVGFPAGGISGISNVVSGSVSSFGFNIDLGKSVDDGAEVLANQLLDSTKQVATTLTYIKAGSPPTVETESSTLR